MTVVIPAGFAQLIFRYTGPSSMGSRPVVVLGVNVAATQDLADAGAAWALDRLIPTMTNGWGITDVLAQDAENSYTSVVGEQGARGDAGSPPNVAVLVKKGADGRGRANQGRSYWPGLTTDAEVADSGILGGTVLANLQELFDSLAPALATSPLNAAQVILHSTPDRTPSDVSVYAVEQQTATQRRRNRR